MNLSPAIRALKSKLAVIDAQHKQLSDAIRALTHLDARQKSDPEPKPKQKRRRHFVYSATCMRCGNLFKAKRHPAKSNPKRGVLFCHKPCTSAMYNQDIRTRTKGAPRIKEATVKTILPGDMLRATVGQH